MKKDRSEMDGVDHINIWTHGQTELGRALAHFTHGYFVVPGIGPFNSMEGYWWFIKTSCQTVEETKARNKLRKLAGRHAKVHGRAGRMEKIRGFKTLIIWGLYQKIIQTPRLKKLLLESTLPFEIYWQKEEDAVETYPSGWEWQTEAVETIRTLLKEGKEMEMPDIDSCFQVEQ